MSILLTAALLALAPAAPTAPATGAEREVTLPGPKGALAGLYRPAGPGAPVVVIIPGSGPTDRDGNNPLGVKGATYRLLAEALAGEGVASVRIDKRGMFASKAAVPDANAVTIAEYAGDARRWAAAAAQLAGVRCAWLAGHSEGALVALVAAQQPAKICGVVSLAGPGRPIGTVLREQLRANPANAPILPDALGAIAALEEGRSVDVAGFAPPLQALFNPALQPFLRDLMAHDPARLAKAMRGPLMIVHGGRDLQVARADADALHAARPDSTLHVVAEANHLLKAVPDDRAANIASYGNPDLPLAPGIAQAIAKFVTAAR